MTLPRSRALAAFLVGAGLTTGVLLLTACEKKAVAKPGPADAGPARPASASGLCRASPSDAGAAGYAHCPDPMEWSRGDGISHRSALPPVQPSVLPPDDMDGLRDFACAYACALPGSRAHLVAWNVIEDDRPLRNHQAAFVIEQLRPRSSSPDAGLADTSTHTVVVMYRHAFNAWWNIAVSFHSPARPIRHLDHRPTTRELLAVLDNNRWDWVDEPRAGGFRLLAGNIVDTEWQAATGEAPTRFHPAAVER